VNTGNRHRREEDAEDSTRERRNITGDWRIKLVTAVSTVWTWQEPSEEPVGYSL
jgi:hypothetical protein